MSVNCPFGADVGHEGSETAVGVSPDLQSRRAVVGVETLQIRVLLRLPATRRFGSDVIEDTLVV